MCKALKNYLMGLKEHENYKSTLFTLSFVVVLLTFYVLILPATTQEKLTCTKTEHTHDESCYTITNICEDGSTDESCYISTLTCTKEEHIHDENCYTSTSSQDVEYLIAMIDELPTVEEFYSKLDELDQTETSDELYLDYCDEILSKAKEAYEYLSHMEESLKEEVTNLDKLLEYEEEGLFASNTTSIYAAGDVVLTVYQTNTFQIPSGSTTLAYSSTSGLTLKDVIHSGGWSFEYWKAVVVEKQGTNYVVTNKIDDNSVKSGLIVPQNGFILLVKNDSSLLSGVSVGNYVSVDLNNSIGSVVSSAAGVGTVTFSINQSTSGLKPAIDNSSKLTTILGADTKNLIEINLYDYGNNINELYNGNKTYPGFQQDGGTKSVTSLTDKYGFNFGNNIVKDSGTIISTVTSNSPSAINKTVNGANSPLSGAMLSTLKDGYPALKNGTSLSYLFTNGTYATKQNKTSINRLFQYNSITGAYTYNSRENHAQFNASNDTFTLYDQIITSNYMMYPFGNFLPLNNIVTQTTQASLVDSNRISVIADSALYKYNNGYGTRYQTLSSVLNSFNSLMKKAYGNNWTAANAATSYFKAAGINKTFTNQELENIYSIDYDEPTDFFFGLEMKMNFMQPKNGKTGLDGNQNMVFYFTGDDDVWVYIDDILFLDLSGIHRHVGGEIDFVNGVVNYYELDVSTGDVSTTPSKTVSFATILGSTDSLNSKGTFKDYSTHSFQFYYMERGAGSGVMRMNFNLPLIHKNSISVTKELTVDDEIEVLGNPDFAFQILKANDTATTEDDELFIKEGSTYDLYNSYGIKLNDTPLQVGENGIFKIKAGQTASFSGIAENAGTYYVRELLDEDWVKQYKSVTVDGTTMTTNSYTSVTIGTDSFAGFVSPIKDISSGNTIFGFNNKIETNQFGSIKINKILKDSNEVDKKFQFYLTIDGTPLAIGTKYKVNGVEVEVKEEGIIEISSKEQAIIEHILAGSQFTLEEKTNSYNVTYQKDGITVADSIVSGVISLENAVVIDVTNQGKCESIEIPFTKTIQNFDGKAHSYQFQLIEIQDTKEVILETKNITIDDIDGTIGKFKINYFMHDYENGITFHRYKIVEVVNPDDLSTSYDSSIYEVEVKITKEESGTFKSEITSITKSGNPVTDILYNNILLSSLSIKKIVESNNTSIDGTFEFELVLENSANKTYKTNKGTITFDENGKTSIQLQHNEELIIYGIVYGSHYSIKELTTNGYVVKYKVNQEVNKEGNEVINQILNKEENTLTFINMRGYELPKTGSSVSLTMRIIGLLFLIVPIVYRRYSIYESKRKWSSLFYRKGNQEGRK